MEQARERCRKVDGQRERERERETETQRDRVRKWMVREVGQKQRDEERQKDLRTERQSSTHSLSPLVPSQGSITLIFMLFNTI
jgi:hypothetical protein